MSIRNWIIAAAVALTAILGFSAVLYACSAVKPAPAVQQQEEDACDDLEDLIDTKEDDCGIGSNRKSPTPKVTRKVPTPVRTTTRSIPTRTR